MFILHVALGGCLKAPPIDFGITADSGGHLAYVMDAALAQAKLPAGHRVTIVTRRFAEADLHPSHDVAHEVVAERVTIDRVASHSPRYLEKEALTAELPSFVDAFLTYLGDLPGLPDVIHAHFADAVTVAVAARRRFGIPFVYTPHALAIDKRAQGLDDGDLDARIADERQAIVAANAMIVSSRDEADRQVQAYGVKVDGRIHCIAPGVPQRADIAGEGGRTLVDDVEQAFDRPVLPIILAIARPVAKKNLAGLVRAYASDPALRDMANLVVLAGQDDGRSSVEERSVRDELQRLCADPALRGRVALPRRHDAADVTALYRRAARGGVFVNPALHEPFGLTLIEAAEAGVPVVATRHGGPAEIVATVGHGVLVDPRDPAAIAAACRRVIGDAAAHARYRAAALANHDRYDWTRYAEQAVAVYAGLHRRPMLLACDIDHTLTGCRVGAEAFAHWRRSGAMHVVVATGRSFADARAVLAQWRLPEPDAFITDVGTRIMLAGEDGGWQACDAYAAGLDADWDLAAVRAALAPLALTPQPVATDGPHKLSFFGTAAAAAAIRTALTTAGLSAHVIFSHGRLIDVLAPGGGKAAAIAAYAGRLGLTLADCVAAGDSGNDADMLERCGGAIVVGNAGEELASLTPRPGLYRAERHHAAGVMEGLGRLGLAGMARGSA
ncbi:glycosyltransferase [Sphingomonas sp. A2-49]|uniref:HAD family hydrolase n=1 Tax=Sphingomonas sp. A2-49 TaxID=1391375 RepID=UPI0021D11DBF|nr:HAD family hydrolase [Sphingomonas sp. A2-49]MCU6454529.1 glycosyltransferase [Sphingomonas sp. A2-49]